MEKSSHLLLASESPRRREMISWLSLPFLVTRATVDEEPLDNERPPDLAVRLAVLKAQAADKLGGNWILAADTIVDFQNNPLGKPKDSVQAHEMLKQLRENMHRVHTGLALTHLISGYISVRRVTTDVWMRKYTNTEMDAYIASEDPFDKAGAYAVQHADFHPVHTLDRCYANVVGLPLCAVRTILNAAGFQITDNIPELCRIHFGYQCPKPDEGMQV